jgi:2-polyprenyl-6-methoxyphenol hydroxylase-like FAD-dependent oxidoreductase
MDVLWFRVPAKPGHTTSDVFRMSGGHMLVVLDRDDYWQLGHIILKGSYHQVKEEGLPAFRANLKLLAPELAEEIESVTDWNQITPLSVESSRLTTWHRPGLLLIGDAAHVMSPVGGVGINIAIQDSVVAANMLATPLLEKKVTDELLAKVQKRREPTVHRIQKLQGMIQEKIVKNALNPNAQIRIPWIMKLPVVRDIPARWIAFGVSHELPVA